MSLSTNLIAGSVLESSVRETNKLLPTDRAVHDWYRFNLAYPAHLVRDYVARFDLDEKSTVLDPFCGTGTTLVECKKLGIRSVGVEANPMAFFASRVKTDWTAEPERLWNHASLIGRSATARMEEQGLTEGHNLPLFKLRGQKLKAPLLELPDDEKKLLLGNSISPLPLHRTLVLLDEIASHENTQFTQYEKLALAKALVSSIGNLHFGPEVGVGKPKKDVAAISIWLGHLRTIVEDLRVCGQGARTRSEVHLDDARNLERVLAPRSISAVITSPPYPNEKDYTRTTRLESVLLGLIRSKKELRALKDTLVRSNTRGVYKADTDDAFVNGHEEIQRIAAAIENQRVKLGKTSGFERLYPRVTRLYFGGLVRHLAALRPALRKGARLAYVVGDQASYLRVMIRTGQILADLARPLGYQVDGIDLFRTRLASATREQLREEVVLLRWPG